MSADAELRGFLARAAARRARVAAIDGGTAGLAAAAIAALVMRPLAPTPLTVGVLGAAIAIVAALVRLLAMRGETHDVAGAVERRAPECRNVVLTASELLSSPATTPGEVRTLVYAHAARMVGGLDPAALFPARRSVAALMAAGAAWASALAFVALWPPATTAAEAGPAAVPRIESVDIVVTPPSYTGRPADTLRNPAGVEAFAGSTIALTVRARASRVALATLTDSHPLAAAGAGVFTGSFTADADGYIALAPSSESGAAGPRSLVGLVVTPDLPPRARITAPGRDLFVDSTFGGLDVAIEATDDVALTSLALRYTKVSGLGERFTFVDGIAPITIARTASGAWTARGRLQLDTLALAPGDVIVYRALATDARPGIPATESDAFIIEVTSPGAVAAGGFSIDDEEDRYAVSQQMVIMRTERLIARRDSLAPAALRDSAFGIAAEQRRVRAEFVFMMGGELADAALETAGTLELDEQHEAEHEDEILAGRLANQGRLELTRAVRSMSLANALLTTASLDSALVHERNALTSIQRAFARTRYLLRALSERERLDVARRLTGDLAGVQPDRRPPADPPRDPALTALRRAMADAAALSRADEPGRGEAAAATQLAERVLRIDPASSALQEIATLFASAASALERTDVAAGRAALERAVAALAARARGAVPPAPLATRSLDDARLGGALTDALRRAGGGQ